MSKKKLCILIDWYLPGTKAGGPVRSIHSIVNLLKDEFDIHLITTLYDLGSSEPYPNIKANDWFEKDKVHYYYFSKPELNQKNIAKVLTTLNSDVIYLNSFWSYWFSIFIVQLKNNGTLKCPVILAPRGMLGKGALTIKASKKQFYLFLSKVRGFYNHILFHATNSQEENDIKQNYKKANVSIIENLNSALPIKIEKEKKEKHLKLFYLSRISKVKNLHFALEILSKTSDQYKIEYDIYGNIEDTSYWDQCLQLIQKMPKHIIVCYKGELSFDSVQETISHYHYLFLPTLNENYGHSIVESLMSACPVIISDQTPWNDLEKAHAGFAIDLANTTKFIKTIEYCADLNSESYKSVSNSSLNYITKKINLSLLKQKYIQLFNEAK